MAKFRTSGLIQSIRGKLGNLTFSSWKGMPTVATIKRKRNPRTKEQIKVWQNFALLFERWDKLSLEQKATWGIYAKKFNKPKTFPTAGIIPNYKRGIMTPANAYVGTNAMLIAIGFPILDKPLLTKIHKPMAPESDLKQYAKFTNGQIKFNIWLPRDYTAKCKAQIWMRTTKRKGYSYVAKIIDILPTPTEAIIDKVKMTSKRGPIQTLFKKMDKCEVNLQMRTIAENGEFSIPTTLYKVEVFP